MGSEGGIPNVIETPSGRILSTLNWLRAGVLGANDGIVSTAAIIFGVAGAAASHATIMLAAIAAIAAGALSMAVGEYVSVATQRDLERAELARQRADLERDPERELLVLAKLFEQRGVTPDIAIEVARQMSAKDALSVHARAELGIDPSSIANPLAAGFASLLAFVVGGLIPTAPILLAPQETAIWIAGAAVIFSLALTGAVAARLGRIPMVPAIVRTVLGGLLATAITYGVGMIAGAQI